MRSIHVSIFLNTLSLLALTSEGCVLGKGSCTYSWGVEHDRHALNWNSRRGGGCRVLAGPFRLYL